MQIAKTMGAEIHALHVIEEDADVESVDDAIKVFELASEEFGVRVRGSVSTGKVADEIIKYAEFHDINLVLMGASDGEVVEKWLSNDVLGHTTIPVLVMPYQLFNSANS